MWASPTSEERPRFPVGVNVFVVEDNKLLLGIRKNTAGDGQWGLPGGHVEKMERMEDTARRELKEEANLDAESFSFVGIVNQTHAITDHYIQIGMLAEGVRGEVQCMEPELCEGWEWFPLDDLPTNIFFGHGSLIESFIQGRVFYDDPMSPDQ